MRLNDIRSIGVATLLLVAACAAPPPVAAPETVGWGQRHVAGEAAREAVRFAAAPLADAWTPIDVAATPVALNLPAYEGPGGVVVFRGGVRLTSDFDRFHGLSDIKFTPDGGFHVVNDEGVWLRGAVTESGGRLTGVRDIEVRPLLDPEARPLVRKFDADSEGLALLDDGQVLISFERDHRIWAYDPQTGRPVGRRRIPEFAFTENDGMEGVAADGRDGLWAAGESGGLWRCTVVLCATVWAPPATPLADADLRIVSLDRDPSGDPDRIYVLQRAFDETTGLTTVRVSLADTRRPLSQALTTVIELAQPGTVDNFEGLAAVRRPDGGVRLYLLSDDNFSARQQTLLLAFDLD